MPEEHPIQYRRALMEILRAAAEMGDRTETKPIAEKLVKSEHTVHKEWDQIHKLLEVHSRPDAMAKARELGLLP